MNEPIITEDPNASLLRDYLARLPLPNPRNPKINLDELRKENPELCQALIR